ncbi:MAG: hypothetical protein JXR56_07730, partial [Candidatus Cloacimonetes bacterium]|nr:hypothetical protein [Candidatus Cloacimonadota bacterium]
VSRGSTVGLPWKPRETHGRATANLREDMPISPVINQSSASSHDRFAYRYSSAPLTPLPM